jgi:hypothetical protein
MAEEFQNTISLYGPVDGVEEIAQRIGAALFENIAGAATGEFILLWNGQVRPESAQDILEGCFSDSVVFEKESAKISLAFQTRRGPFPVAALDGLMEEFPGVYMEIQTLGDCSGSTGILAKDGKNLAIRRLGLGANGQPVPSLFCEYSAWRNLLAQKAKHAPSEMDIKNPPAA